MARSNRRDVRKPGITRQDRRPRRKICLVCQERPVWVDYKDTSFLRRFLSDRAKIKARRVTGTCAQHQRDVAVAIKTARELALLPYTARPAAKDGARGGGGRGRGPRPSGRPADRVASDEDGSSPLELDVEVGSATGTA